MRNIWEWLSPPDPWKNHSIMHETRHAESGMWLVQGNTYAKWKSSGPSSLLWINGKRQYFAIICYLELTVTVSAAGAGKSFVWYDNILIVVFARLCYKVVPQSLTTSDRYSKLAWHHLHSFIATSGRIKRGTAVGYFRHSWSSLVNSPMHTPPNFLVSMRPMVAARNMQATTSY